MKKISNKQEDKYEVLFKKSLKYLIKRTKKNNEEIAEYWFQNKDELSKVLDGKYPNYSQIFDLIIRWHTPIGIECNKKIIDFMFEILRKHNIGINKIIQEQGINASLRIAWPVIDFSVFKFNYMGEEYTLQRYVKLYNTSQIGGLNDLRGANISNISIGSCVIINCFFANATFYNCNMQQVEFRNCIFSSVNFNYSRLVSIRYDSETRFSNNSFKYSFLNSINMKNISTPNSFIKPTYWKLLSDCIKYMLYDSSKIKIHDNSSHTVFSCLTTDQNNDKRDVEFISYVD